MGRLRTVQGATILSLALGACAPAGSSTAAASPRTLVERAIDQAGGAAALRRASALTWDGDAVVHAGGRQVRISGTWKVQPPDTAVVGTYAVERGPETMRYLVLAAPRGWTVARGAFTPMDTAMLAAERVEFYLYDVMRLVPLLDRGVVLRAVASDSAGNAGVVVQRSGRPDVRIYFDAAGRMAHLNVVLPNADGSGNATQDMWFSGTVESNGVRWPQRIHLLQNGQPYFDLVVKSLTTSARITDTLVAGPRR